MITDRRKFIAGAIGLIAAPAVVRIANIMSVRGIVMPVERGWFRYSIEYANGNYGEWTGRYFDGCFDFGKNPPYIRSGDTLRVLQIVSRDLGKDRGLKEEDFLA
jgi:hypothetical protein